MRNIPTLNRIMLLKQCQVQSNLPYRSLRVGAHTEATVPKSLPCNPLNLWSGSAADSGPLGSGGCPCPTSERYDSTLLLRHTSYQICNMGLVKYCHFLE